MDKYWGTQLCYSVDRDLFNEQHYPPFEQLGQPGPDLLFLLFSYEKAHPFYRVFAKYLVLNNIVFTFRLYGNALVFLSSQNEVKQSVAEFMSYVHTSVNEESQLYLANERRYNYTTPKSFLEQVYRP